MKKTITLILGCLIFLFSCEDIFHEPETSIGDIQTEEELIQAAEGVWGKLNWAINYPEPLSYYYQNLKGDDITYQSGNYAEYYPHELNTCFKIYDDAKYYYGNYPNYLYESFYQVIASINNILTQYPDYYQLSKEFQCIIGEMLLLRAYCYFRLTRTYGRIPLVIDIEVNSNINLPAFEQIYNRIENDLIIASNLLPQTSQSSRTPYKRPGKGTAKALLAEVYLNWAGYPIKDNTKYKIAAEVTEGLIDSAFYYGFELLPDYANLWQNKTNNELVLALYFSDIANISGFDQVNLLFSNFLPHIVNQSTWQAYAPWDFREEKPSQRSCQGIVNSNFYAAELNFFNRYPSGYRKDITFFTNIYVPPYFYMDELIDTGYVHIDKLRICNRAKYRKFFRNDGFCYLYDNYYNLFNSDTLLSGGAINFTGQIYICNEKIYLYRFAHILLTFAEAKARSGQVDAKTYEAVNRIRRRAHNVDQFTPSVFDLTPNLSTEVFADSVVWERAWEFAGEPEGRYFDLLRLEKLEDLSKYRHPKEDSPPWHRITKEDYFLPIPTK